MKRVTGGLRFVGWSMLGLVVLVVAALMLVQTDYARSRLEPALGQLLSSTTVRVEIAGLQYRLPLDLRIASLKLADAAGVWLELEDTHLEVRPGDLLEGRVAITDLSARSLLIHRQPMTEEAEPRAPSGPFHLVDQLAGLPEVSLDRLLIERIALGEPLLGQRLELKLAGALALIADGHEIGIEALLERIDGKVGKVELAGRFAPPFRDLDLRLAVLDQGGLLASLAKEPRIGSVDIALAGRGPLERWPGKLRAAIDGVGRAEGELRLNLTNAPSLDLTLALRPEAALIPSALHAIVGEQVDLGLAAGLTADGDMVLTRLVLDTAAISMESPGLTLTAGGKIAGELTMEAADLAKFATLAGHELAGRMKVVMLPGGTADAPSVQMSLDASGLRTATVPLDAIKGQLTAIGRGAMAKDGVDIKGLDLAIDDLHARLQGQLGFGVDGKIDGIVELQVADLVPLGKLVGQPLAGKVTLKAVPGGSLDAATVAISGEARGLAFDGRHLGGATLAADAEHGAALSTAKVSLELGPADFRVALRSEGRLQGRALEISSLKLSGPKLGLDGHGTIDLATGHATAELEGQASDLAVLEPLIGKGFAGTLELKASLDQRDGKQDVKLVLDARRLVASGTLIESARLEAAAQDLLDSGPIKAVLELTNLQSGESIVERGRLQASGAVTNPTIELGLAGTAAKLPFDLTSRAQLAPGDAKQTLRLDSLKGRLANEPIELVKPVAVGLDGKVIDVGQLELKIGAARVTARGRLAGDAVKAELAIDSLPLTMLTAFGAPPLAGKAKLQATLAGRPDAPDLVANLDLTGLSPRLDNKKANINAVVSAKLTAGRELVATSRVTGLGTEPLTANAQVPVRFALMPFALSIGPETALDGKIGGSVQLAKLGELLVLDGQKLEGTAKIDLKLTGTVGTPGLQGRIDLRQGLVEDAVSGFSLRQIQASIVASNTMITMERLSGRDRGKGEMTGKGEVDLTALTYKMDLAAKQFEAIRGELGRATLSGTAELRGDASEAKLKSRLEVDRAEIGLPDPGPSLPATIRVKEVGGTRQEPLPEPSAGPPFIVQLDMHVDLPGQVFLRGHGLDSEWKGKIRVKGTSLEPDVRGELESKRGTLDFLGTRFAVAESKVQLDGARPPVPALEIVAKAKKQDITAIVRVRGRADKPKIVLESDPTLPRDEILARVLFNKEMSRITPLQAATLANAVATLDGGGIDLVGKLRQSTGLDTLDVGGDGTTEAAARAGKYLSDDIYLEVQKGLGPESGKARVEIDLGRNLKATTEVTETNQSGARLEWKYDY